MTDSLVAIQQECFEDSTAWFGGELVDNLAHQILALCGEVGETANLLKKIQRGSIQFDEESRGDLIEEMTDVFIYVVNIFNCLRANVGDSYDIKRSINADRFGGTSRPTL